jgi:hypothetical protein
MRRIPSDWVLPTVWALSMHAVAAGLMAMVFSSYIMWYRLKALWHCAWAALLASLRHGTALLA